MNNLIKRQLFFSSIYYLFDDNWLNNLNNLSDKYIFESKNENLKNNIEDFGFAHHSSPLQYDINFKDFSNFICKISYDILDEQGYDMNKYVTYLNELWVQEFSKKGGGHHSSHTHWNGHISGFYFLKISSNTSKPIFHDPRSGKLMINLQEKNKDIFTEASPYIVNNDLKPGTFIFFNSYLPHEFMVDYGIEDFRFIHFNVQAVQKELINNSSKRISS